MKFRALQRSGLLVLAIAPFTPSLEAWSESGHRIVALAAQENLSDNAKRRVEYLLGKDAQLAAVAYWADEIVQDRPETDAWHSITIPPTAKGVDLDRDCPLGDCLTVKIRDCMGIVRLAVKPKSEIVDAFKMLVNLAADLHQPLRNGYPPALGKDEHIVVLADREMRLFEAWDGELLEHIGAEAILERVRRRIASMDKRAWTQGTLNSWTWETHRVAVEQIYPMVPSDEKEVLDASTVEAAAEILVDQLAKAAVRLVHMLDDVWP